MALNKSRCVRFAPLQACALATITAGSFATAYAQSSEETVKFDLPPQSLEQALKDFGVSADKQLLFATDLAEGKTVAGLSGEMEPMKALDELLDGTGLVYETTLSNVILVKIADVDEADDRDSKKMNPQPVLMTQNQTTEAQTTVSNWSENDEEAQESEAPVPFEEIIVTGTNIRGVENPTVPILTFDREDIQNSGAATVDDFLRTIPQNFASNTQLTNESGNPNTAPNVTQGTTVDLRGLGAGSTLTLLNGRRMTPAGNSNFVDVNVLPLGVIERVDVLTDGATAVYGSDAVGGVVNFVTRKDFEGFDVNARYGTVTEGSKQDWGVGGAGGFNWGSGGVFAGVDYQEKTPLLAIERDFVDFLLPQEGTRFGSDSQRLSIAGGVNQALGSSVRLGIDVLYTDINNESSSIDTAVVRTNTSEQNAIFINSNLEYDLTDDITLSFFMDYGKNNADNEGFTPTAIVSSAVFENELFLYEGRISGSVLELLGGTVSFSVGGLYREEKYDSNQNNFTLTGRRNVTAGYAEVLVPIVGPDNALPFVQKLNFSLAGRYEDYSDVGDSFDPKVGVYWEVGDQLSLRASYAESFRASDLQTLNGSQQWVVTPLPLSVITSISTPEPSTFPLPFPFPDFALVAFSTGFNPNLGPETARSWSAGFTYQPKYLDGLTVEGNFFDISYKDRIEAISFINVLQDSSLLSLLDASPALADVEALFASAAAGEIDLFTSFGEVPADIDIIVNSGFQNVSERDVTGFDLIVDYTMDTNIGQFSAGANASYLTDYTSRLTDLSPESEQVNVLYRPVDFKMRAYLSWSQSGFTAFTALNYVDGYRDHIDTSIANSIDAWTTIDVSLAYETGNRFHNVLLDGVRFNFSVTNLFDNDPPFVATPFGLNYDSANANPFNRQINISVSKRF